MAVHMLETLIILLMVESCIANFETIEFRLGDRKLRVPLNNPAIVELNEDGNLEDIRIIQDQDEINKQAYTPPKQAVLSSTPQRRLLEPERRMPIQRTPEDYRHPSQPNSYKFHPNGDQEYLTPQRRPINQYPEAQFSRYPQDKQLLHQHYSAPHLQSQQYSPQIQPQTRYPNGYRNPYQPPSYDPLEESHVHNIQRAPPYYPNYDYHDPYYGNNFPRSRPQENYVPNRYLTKSIDFNRRNPNTYYPQEPDQYDTREFPGTGPQDSRIKAVEPQRENIYSQNSPRVLPITRKEDNFPEMLPDFQKHKQALKTLESVEIKSQSYKSSPAPIQAPPPARQDKSRRPPPPESQKYKQAYKIPQSFEDKQLPHKSPPIPKRTPPRALQDKSRQSRPQLIENFKTIHPTPEPETVQRPIHRKPDNMLKSREITRDKEISRRRPGMAERKPIAVSNNFENFSSRTPVTPEFLFTKRLPVPTKEKKLPPSPVVDDKPYISRLQPIRTTPSNLYPEYYSPTPKNIIRNKPNGFTEYPDISSSILKTTTNSPDFSQLIRFTEATTVKEPPIDDTPVKPFSVENVTKEKTEFFDQTSNATETISNKSDVQDTIVDDSTSFKSLEKDIASAPQEPTKRNTDSSVYNENVTTDSNPLNIATDVSIQYNSSKHSISETSDSSLITNINSETGKNTSSVLNTKIEADTLTENLIHSGKISSLDTYMTTEEPVAIKTAEFPVEIEQTKIEPDPLPTLAVTTNNPYTSSNANNEFDENNASKISKNDTLDTIKFSNDQKDVSSEIPQTTTDSPLVDTETESSVLFIPTKKPVQTTTIKLQTTASINSNEGLNTHEIPLSVHYIRIDAPEESKVTDSADASTDAFFISSLTQETEKSNPGVHVRESILQVSKILENTTIDHGQNAAETYSHVDYTTAQPLTNITTDYSDNYETADVIATLAPDEDNSFNNTDTSAYSSTANVYDQNSSSDVAENKKTETMTQDTSERRMQFSATKTQSSSQIVQNTTLTETRDAVTTKSKSRRRPCKHKKKHGHKHNHSGHKHDHSDRRRRRRRRTTTVPPSTFTNSSLTTPDNIR